MKLYGHIRGIYEDLMWSR